MSTPAISTLTPAALSVDDTDALRDLPARLDLRSGDSLFLSFSSRADVGAIEAAVAQWPGTIVGCSTAGELTPDGIGEGTINAIKLSRDHGTSRAWAIDGLADANESTVLPLGKEIRGWLAELERERPGIQAFGVLLIDGLSVREEQIVSLIHTTLPDLPLVGGSAGDDLAFDQTLVLHEGTARPDRAVLWVYATEQPFYPFKTQHFSPSPVRMVITEADPATRRVYRINGRPAAEEYSRRVGIPLNELAAQTFSTNPVMLRIGGDNYVRSIQRAHEDGSLTFYCAIEEGLVLTVANSGDLVEDTRKALEQAAEAVGRPTGVLAFECVLRRLEILQLGLTDQIDRLYAEHGVVGFHTYGEQFGSIHVNQTLTGVVFG